MMDDHTARHQTRHAQERLVTVSRCCPDADLRRLLRDLKAAGYCTAVDRRAGTADARRAPGAPAVFMALELGGGSGRWLVRADPEVVSALSATCPLCSAPSWDGRPLAVQLADLRALAAAQEVQP